jgi:hypothetical protein
MVVLRVPGRDPVGNPAESGHRLHAKSSRSENRTDPPVLRRPSHDGPRPAVDRTSARDTQGRGPDAACTARRGRRPSSCLQRIATRPTIPPTENPASSAAVPGRRMMTGSRWPAPDAITGRRAHSGTTGSPLVPLRGRADRRPTTYIPNPNAEQSPSPAVRIGLAPTVPGQRPAGSPPGRIPIVYSDEERRLAERLIPFLAQHARRGRPVGDLAVL